MHSTHTCLVHFFKSDENRALTEWYGTTPFFRFPKFFSLKIFYLRSRERRFIMWESIIEVVSKVNGVINGVVWGWPMIILILGTGILITVRTKCMQVRRFGTSLGETIVPTVKSIGKKKKGQNKKENSISQFEAFATAISGTVGTGNIVGVTSAIMTGGPGAVFWMWISAFFGMITNYAENVLGLYFRKKEKDGGFSGGPAYYLAEGLGRGRKDALGSFLKTLGKILGVMAAVFCTLKK